MRFAAALAASAAMAAAAEGPSGPGTESDDRYNQGYRAGYDEGFQRGYEKGLREGSAQAPAVAPGPPPRATGPITISRAVYGTSSKGCDATRWAARMANGRASATLDVSNSICGDPAPGDRKSLDVTYVCGSIAKSATAYEHRSVYLDCTP
ncbi:MAG TPA: hypothetical protein VLT60_07745 [Usitatibacter sp.]|nr:hypothetical protein [Usitatibacter sp.]